MIRIVVKVSHICPEGAVTGIRYRTFDIEHPELEKALTEIGTFTDASIIGGGVIAAASTRTEQR